MRKITIMLAFVLGFGACFALFFAAPEAMAQYVRWGPPEGGLVAQRVEPDAMAVTYTNYSGGIPGRVRKVYPDGTIYNHYYTVAGGVVTAASTTWTEAP